ncbi:hypothetical protein [Stenotrophomonas maltophilia]|uniref:hypothetical protein n=1 Tax=Stenotrophomonas maltophilia TaxID=40324 RepID=UPI0008DC97F4|nr:hypothetical protein [Stenotrophomonas maltophilia]OHY64668.1 hypothetical protein BB780_17765 [Stenotrophomonas maltophilia]
MKTNKTLADAQPGGRVRLGDHLPPLPYPNYPVSKTGLQNNAYTASQMMDYARAALSAQPSPGERRFHHVSQVAKHFGLAVTPEEMGEAIANAPRSRFSAESAAAAFANVQPSPGGQGDSRSEKAATFLRQYLTYLRSSPRQGLRPRWCDVYEALEVAIEALAARQPSKQPDSVALGEATEFCIEKGDRKPVHGSGTLVDSGALQMALNVLRRAGKDEVADALESTAARQPEVK